MKSPRCIAISLLLIVICFASEKASATTFENWLRDFKKEAIQKGISPLTLEKTFKSVKPLPRVIELDRRQPEFTLTFKQYLDRVVSKRRTKIGKSKLIKHRDLLSKVSQKFNVQPRFIVALWGVETDFGRITGRFPVISSLATLAFDGRRSNFFRKELILALKIIEDGHITAKAMKGSWAGAMGQNQFMPSSFHSFAIDYDGDGSADIWNSLPDIFASIANYLSKSGWNGNQNWGRPVLLPTTFPKKLVGKKVKKKIQSWGELGVKKANGMRLPIAKMSASIIRPEKGGLGPAYIIYNNYRVILKWNRSNYFATAVGILADSLR